MIRIMLMMAILKLSQDKNTHMHTHKIVKVL